MVLKLTYAYDVGPYSNDPSQNHASIGIFLDTLEWSGCFILRVSKCRSFPAMVFTKKETHYKAHLKKK